MLLLWDACLQPLRPDVHGLPAEDQAHQEIRRSPRIRHEELLAVHIIPRSNMKMQSCLCFLFPKTDKEVQWQLSAPGMNIARNNFLRGMLSTV